MEIFDTEEEINSSDSQDSDNTSTKNTEESSADNTDDSKKSKEIFIYKDKVVESKEDDGPSWPFTLTNPDDKDESQETNFIRNSSHNEMWSQLKLPKPLFYYLL